uniref:Uncharacterized protein n=1 Tax=Macrostomum lignano TaxID=282301 RepID=A0A1I8FIU1_9PLAT
MFCLLAPMKQVKKHPADCHKAGRCTLVCRGQRENRCQLIIISETHNDITCDSEIILLNSPTAAHAMFSFNYLADNSDQDSANKAKTSGASEARRCRS